MNARPARYRRAFRARGCRVHRLQPDGARTQRRLAVISYDNLSTGIIECRDVAGRNPNFTIALLYLRALGWRSQVSILDGVIRTLA